MPPQAGIFALPYKAARTADTHPGNGDIGLAYGSTRSPLLSSLDDPSKVSKDRKRRDIAGKLGKDLAEQRRDDIFARYSESLASHQAAAHQLTLSPEYVPEYVLALYPISLERAAALHQLALDEEYSLECAQAAWEDESTRIEEEWKKGQEKVRDRMLEGIEERRKRAREDKDGEPSIADASVDPQSRPHITRKLRNKMSGNQSAGGRSPSPTPNGNTNYQTNTHAFTNPYSLALDTLPSPFPLALPLKDPPRRGGKQQAPNQQSQGGGKGGNADGGGQGGGVSATGPLGKAVLALQGAKDLEIESDLNELRRGARRKRQAAANPGRI